MQSFELLLFNTLTLTLNQNCVFMNINNRTKIKPSWIEQSVDMLMINNARSLLL